MKKQNLLLPILIAFFIISCTSDDNQLNEEEQNISDLKLYKKTNGFYDGKLIVSQEVFYNNDNNIESITLNEVDYINRTFTVDYSNGNVSGITRSTDVINPYGTDENINFNKINTTDNTIILISDNSDKTLEINFSDGYIDSTKFYPTSNPNNVFEQTFTRNQENQLIRNISGGDTFEYSNFDTNKKLEPFGSVMEYEHNTFFMIFGLKVSRDNPATATYNFSGGGTYSNYLEYDEHGYVTKVSYDEPNSTSNYSVNEYILK